MHKICKPLCVIMCAVLLFLSFAADAFAETKQGRITNDKVNMRDKATTDDSKVILTLSKDTVITINSKVAGQEAESGGGTEWYNISYEGNTGYVYGKYVEETAAAPYDEDFEKNLLNFPKSYRSALRKIHNTYPNWVFVADKLSINLDYAIGCQYGSSKISLTKKWVELAYGIEWRDPRVNGNGNQYIMESRWTYASRQAIAFFMDPRNALKVTNTKDSYPNIFTFLQHSYDPSTQTEAGLKTVISGTFMEKGYGGDKNAYIKDITEAAKQSGVSPYVIAGMIIIEQGVKGASGLISGTYKGYEGFYNFFNYGAYGGDVIKNGLAYAKNKNWNTRRKSIVGGAKLYAEGYINKGQDTYYYMDFNVKANGGHQYASSLYDQCVKAVSMRSVCTANKKAAMTFKIPVYSALPAAVYAAPSIESYSSTAEEKSVSSTDKKSNNAVSTASEVSSEANKRKIGDASGDGKVNGRDLAFIKLYLLNLRKFKAIEFTASDVSKDGKVNGRDLAIVKLYLLGLKKLN